ncbi:MAG: PQQ-binding-like beta-propeller repeat protein [Polyangiaceae bacterium]
MRRRLLASLSAFVFVGLAACGGSSDESDEASAASTNGRPCHEGGPCIGEKPLDPTSAWPKFRGNMRQTGRSRVLPRKTGGKMWSYRTGKGIFSSAVIGGDGTVYIGSADRTFYALSSEGDVKWSVQTGEIIDSSALLDDKGRVYFGSGDGHLRALDQKTGKEIWKFEAEDPSVNKSFIRWFEGNVAIGPGGDLYAPNDNFSVYSVNRDSGARNWRWLMNDQTWSLPAVDPATGSLYIGNNYIAAPAVLGYFYKNVFAIDKDGNQIWRQGINATVSASPLLTENGKMILGGFDGYLRAYDKNDGTELWSFGTYDHLYASPAELQDGTIVQPSADGTIYAVDPANGKLKWAFETREPVRSSPAVDGEGNIYFGGGDGKLYVLTSKGKLRWSIKLVSEDRNDLNGSPSLGRDAIVIAGESGEIFNVPYDYCLRAEAANDTRCSVGTGEGMPDDGTYLYFTTPLGSILSEAPPSIAANVPLAFSLVVREKGDTKLSLIDEKSLKVTVDPPAEVDARVSGDRRFVTVVPTTKFTKGANGKVRITIQGDYLQDPTRSGIVFSGGRKAGRMNTTFDFDVAEGPAGYDYPVPDGPGDPSGVLEMYRIAVPLPTVMPSYNQIGFDSLHYLVSMVEKTPGGAIGWVTGGKLDEKENRTVVDPETKVLFPVEVSYENGLMTLLNKDSFMINAMNADLPFETFRVSAHLDAKGIPVSQPGVHVTTRCQQIPTYGPFLVNLGFCNPDTDLLNVFGSTNLRPFGSGRLTAPSGLGTVSFAHAGGWGGGTITNPTITATLEGSSLKLADHTVGLLIVDVSTGKPVSVQYGLATTRTATATGEVATVSVNFLQSKAPKTARVYLMVDGYPAARRTLALD